MNKPARLYKIPFIVGGILLAISIALGAIGIYISSVDENTDGFALIAFGVLFFISGITTVLMYAYLEGKFRKTLQQPILDYELYPEQYNIGAEINANEIKSTNKMSLFIMLFFCAITIVFGFFVEDDGYIISIIGLCLAVFITLCFLIITAARVNKVKKGSKRVILAAKAAYISGTLHVWGIPSIYLQNVQYFNEPSGNDIGGYIGIEYLVIKIPAPDVVRVVVPVPNQYIDQALVAVEIIRTNAGQVPPEYQQQEVPPNYNEEPPQQY